MGATSTRAPEGATTLTIKDDADILAAWATYNQAREIYDTTPDEGPYIMGVNAAQQAQIDIMGPAETLIGEAVPTSLRGIEIQLWSMLVHSADTQVAATLARTEQLDACPDHFDWIDCHALNAIRAVREMTAKSEENDAAIISAWDRRAAAFLTVRELPDEPAIGGGETPEQKAQWDIIDAAEAEIRNAVACTPRGAEIQLWTAATHSFDSAEDEEPCYRGDLDYFVDKGDALDWMERLMVSALRSLRAMGGVK